VWCLLSGLLLRLLQGERLDPRLPVLGGPVLRLAVVLLGFGLPLATVLETGRATFLPSLVSIVGILSLGWLLARLLRVEGRLGFLVSGGTAICGGSAIASLAPAIGAGSLETGVSLAVVFILNAVSLVVFPVVGHWLALSSQQYATWCALGIHDTSSVAGAAASMGAGTLSLALSMKLTRSLWILPLSLAASRYAHTGAGLRVPWFLFGFVAASACVAFLPAGQWAWTILALGGRHLLGGAVFLVGLGVPLRGLAGCGRAFLQGTVLWFVSAVGILLCVRFLG
jgi:uncharacterized membrane protein YadS